MDLDFFTPDNSLIALFLSSFLGATVLPGGSEAVLFALLKLHPELLWSALAIASIGNTLGALTSYLLGRFLPQGRNHRAAGWLQRHGSPVLLLAWAPLIGDALCVAAGWLRINPWHAALFMLIGKAARYGAVAFAST
ncbi:membrane protein [Sulfurimicrobium lacus]|uniref:Membrane protein n=1 Tax=Sulfurimicrobium lacus TaxID=2715678 RepID=A0A6F8VG54_9PROT|nr:YqaA family protein [Sulfurimicrobium lacus]BCB28654.1 membrane protein [Sulfurimicrobium lacus]